MKFGLLFRPQDPPNAENIGRRGSLVSLPDFKSPEAYVYPLSRLGSSLVGPSDGDHDSLLVLCDGLFNKAIGANCGGAAEDNAAARLGTGFHLSDRFEAAPGRWLSLYVNGP